jgi:predicted ATPase
MISMENPEPNLSYTFTNSLIKDVLYNSMLFNDRRAIHKEITDILEKEHAGKNAFYPILAHHSKQAEQYEDAVQYLVKVLNNEVAKFA